MATIDETINQAFKPIASAFNDLVFYSIPVGESQLPLIVVWLIAGALYFTFYLKLINIRGFTHAIRIVLGKEDKTDTAPGEISHFRALTTAVSGPWVLATSHMLPLPYRLVVQGLLFGSLLQAF